MRRMKLESLEQRQLLAVTVYGAQSDFAAALPGPATTVTFEASSGFDSVAPGELARAGIRDGVEFDGSIAKASDSKSGNQVFTGSSGFDDTAVVEFDGVENRPSGIGFYAHRIGGGRVVRVAVEFENGPNRIFDVHLSGSSRFFGVIDPEDRIVDVAIFAQGNDNIVGQLQPWALDNFTYNEVPKGDGKPTPGGPQPQEGRRSRSGPVGKLGDVDLSKIDTDAIKDALSKAKDLFDSIRPKIKSNLTDLHSFVDKGAYLAADHFADLKKLALDVQTTAADSMELAHDFVAEHRSHWWDVWADIRETAIDHTKGDAQDQVEEQFDRAEDILDDSFSIVDKVLSNPIGGGPSNGGDSTLADILSGLGSSEDDLRGSGASADEALTEAADQIRSIADPKLTHLLEDSADLVAQKTSDAADQLGSTPKTNPSSTEVDRVFKEVEQSTGIDVSKLLNLGG